MNQDIQKENTMAYMKADEWVGRSLTLQVGRGDVTINDGVKYRDTRLHRYVGMGFLKLVADEDKSPTVSIPNEKLPVKPEKLAVTRATPPVEPAAFVDDAMRATTRKLKARWSAEAAPEVKTEDSTPKVEAKEEPVKVEEPKNEGVITKSPMSKVKSGGRRTSTKRLEGDKS